MRNISLISSANKMKAHAEKIKLMLESRVNMSLDRQLLALKYSVPYALGMSNIHHIDQFNVSKFAQCIRLSILNFDPNIVEVKVMLAKKDEKKSHLHFKIKCTAKTKDKFSLYLSFN